MKGASSNKWVQDGSNGASTRQVAASVLEDRLADVVHLLDQASQPAKDDTDCVHKMRVGCRRAQTALQLFRPLLVRRHAQWLRKQLRRIRRAANTARDCVVVSSHLAKSDLPGANRWAEKIATARDSAKGPIKRLHDKLMRKDRLPRAIDKVLADVRPSDDHALSNGEPSFGEWARAQLQPVIADFFAVALKCDIDSRGLHETRLCVKQLRYTMELVGAAFPKTFRSELYPAIEELQDRLGEISDLSVTVDQLRKRRQITRRAKRRRELKRLIREEKNRLQWAILTFRQQCNSEGLHRLWHKFAAYLEEPSSNRLRAQSARHESR